MVFGDTIAIALMAANHPAGRIGKSLIFKILVWKVVPKYNAPSSTSPMEDHIDQSYPFSNHILFHYQQFEAVHMDKLAGHEGSLFRITWSSDGSNLVSVSDDLLVFGWFILKEMVLTSLGILLCLNLTVLCCLVTMPEFGIAVLVIL
ncbi:uncharacterized protein LOC126706855 isoform X4 [Quercus robur]|nr:uncharacterized protein LOC126706855 isoform X4 [Quercus robur]